MCLENQKLFLSFAIPFHSRLDGVNILRPFALAEGRCHGDAKLRLMAYE
jgi:hypothetical protein